MAWLRDIHQTLSFKLGYGRGLRGRPFKCPWWVDPLVYAVADFEGYKAFLEGGGKAD